MLNQSPNEADPQSCPPLSHESLLSESGCFGILFVFLTAVDLLCSRDLHTLTQARRLLSVHAVGERGAHLHVE